MGAKVSKKDQAFKDNVEIYRTAEKYIEDVTNFN